MKVIHVAGTKGKVKELAASSSQSCCLTFSLIRMFRFNICRVKQLGNHGSDGMQM